MSSGASETPTARALLQRHGLHPKKHLGQNFLTDRAMATRIAELAVPASGGTVIEIGAGVGALTRPLLDRCTRVIAIERDPDLLPILAEQFDTQIRSGTLELCDEDARRLSFVDALEGAPTPHVLAGNLPYYITGPLLERATGISERVSRVVFLVQLEVAARLTAAPSTPEYGALTVFVRAAFRAKRRFIIRSGAFFPKPRVDSAVVLLEPHDVPLARETHEFRAVVRAAFGQRRKKLKNAWRGLLARSDEEVAAAAKRAEISLDLRGETLDVTDFARMTAEMTK